MGTEIGSAYFRTRARLQNGIRESALQSLVAEPDDHACYFCGRRITGRMHVIRENEKIMGFESETEYYVGERCYRRSFFFEYLNGMESSLS